LRQLLGQGRGRKGQRSDLDFVQHGVGEPFGVGNGPIGVGRIHRAAGNGGNFARAGFDNDVVTAGRSRKTRTSRRASMCRPAWGTDVARIRRGPGRRHQPQRDPFGVHDSIATVRSNRSAISSARHVLVVGNGNPRVSEMIGPDPRRQSLVVDQRRDCLTERMTGGVCRRRVHRAPRALRALTPRFKISRVTSSGLQI
jgi:hypothetical protein